MAEPSGHAIRQKYIDALIVSASLDSLDHIDNLLASRKEVAISLLEGDTLENLEEMFNHINSQLKLALGIL